VATSGIKYRILTRHGHPATEILRLADDEDADLIVVGNGLNSTMAEIFLGSVAHAVTHHANRPLVIVPSHVPAASIDSLGRKQRAENATVVTVPGPLMAAG
jgi:nucleotide-binding universal stress UspA family protein